MKMDGQGLNTSVSGVDDERHDPGSVRAFHALRLTVWRAVDSCNVQCHAYSALYACRSKLYRLRQF